MTKQPETTKTTATCKWRRGLRCSRRRQLRPAERDGNPAARGKRRPLGVRYDPGHVPPNEPEMENPRCAQTAGRHCPFRPYFDSQTLQFLFRGKRLTKYRNRCKQVKLLQAFEERGWPRSIKDPLGEPSPLDPEKGLRDIVDELNQRQKRVRFHNRGRRVYWQIVRD